MNAIIGMTGIALAHIDKKEKVRDCLEKISSSSAHLLSLINDVRPSANTWAADMR